MKYTRFTALQDVFKGVDFHGTVAMLPDLRKLAKTGAPYEKQWAQILMACEKEQTEALLHLWYEFVPDDDIMLAWFTIVKRGLFAEFLDPEDRHQREMFCLTVAAIDAGKTIGALNAPSRDTRGRPSFRRRDPRIVGADNGAQGGREPTG